jgi:hypothetical protein
MAKRTVTRFFAGDPARSGYDFPVAGSFVVHLEWDDGLPEPSKCPHDWPEAMGCSECLKLNQSPETRERRVDGFVHPRLSKYTEKINFYTNPYNDDNQPATLIIHEPVKDMTLVEACETVIAKSATVQDTFRLSPIIEALAREKAKK